MGFKDSNQKIINFERPYYICDNFHYQIFHENLNDIYICYLYNLYIMLMIY
jgi:hypothetical protein